MRSYCFNQSEIDQTNNGLLDVVCGFSVLDDDYRIIVIEGLAGVDQGMQSVFLDIPRLKPNDKDLKILCNPEVLFSKRFWGLFIIVSLFSI